MEPVLTHAWLTRLRDRLPLRDPMQRDLAPLEHRAYAREAVAENPLMAVAIATGIPLWQLAKMFGVPARTPPAMDQVWGGYTGILEGLGQRVRENSKPEAMGVLAGNGGIRG